MRRIGWISLLGGLLAISIYANGQKQTRAELEKKRTQLMKEIDATQQLLKETKQNKNATLSELRALQTQLQARQQLINTMNSEITTINSSISNTAQEVEELNHKLAGQKQRFAQSVRYAYKHKDAENMVAFIFAAEDFNEALRRLQYLKKLREYRKLESDKIATNQTLLASKINKLSTEKTNKSSLLSAEEKQRLQIQQETAVTNQLVNELKGKESELMTQIKKDQQASQKIQNSIATMIRQEIALAKKKAEEEAKKRAAEEARRKAEALAKAKADEDARKKAELAKANEVKLNTGSSTGTEPKPSTPTSTPKPTETVVKTETKTPSNTSVTNSNKSAYAMGLTPEVQSISKKFAENQGRLPWPVDKGYISSHYGKQAHPVYTSVTLDNIGIDITTSANAPVRAVFEGTVTKVANIDGMVIMVSHGEYFTIYSKLSNANVKVGDKVSAKQNIGAAGKNDDGANVVNFQVWKISGSNFNSVNPSSWIAK